MTIDISAAKAIKGWMTDEELRWLASRAADAAAIVEVGCFRGRSTRALADHCAGVVYAVDPWSGVYYRNDGAIHRKIRTDVLPDFSLNLSAHIAAGRVVPIQGESLAGAVIERLVCDLADGADLVFLDGDHRYDIVKAEIETYSALVKAGGVLAGHDYTHHDWPGVRRAVDEAFPHVRTCGSIWWVEL